MAVAYNGSQGASQSRVLRMPLYAQPNQQGKCTCKRLLDCFAAPPEKWSALRVCHRSLAKAWTHSDDQSAALSFSMYLSFYLF